MYAPPRGKGNRMHVRVAVLAALGLIALSLRASPVVYSISDHVISNGSTVRSTSNCYKLDAIISEPAVGYSSSTVYGLSAGFSYINAPVSDTIFANSFEDCSS